METPKLQTDGISKVFRGLGGTGSQDVHALEGIDIEARAGEFVSIVGPSGCGKSTLFNILAGLIEPTGGRVLLDGNPTDQLLGTFGYMPQKDLLMPWRTVLNNTTLGLEIAGFSRRAARHRALEDFPRFGLTGFEDAWPTSLSGGMRQRAALLRTFLAGREVMLLDEPFGALDALTRQEMQSWLLQIWQADRKTIVFVTHDVEEAVYLSDRVYVLSGRPGHVVMQVEIDLPRPRPQSISVTARFIELKQRLIEPLFASLGAPIGTAS
jgi:ABC-type nitrate/sulfonate/bicarbonate transport system ATPase subunit